MERGDLTGAILDGRYRVIEPIAEGAMGVVYRAERLKLGRIVAIKVLHDVLPNELSARKRFEIEARAMAKLEHPHCASVLDVGVHLDRPFVVMDFVSGDNLKTVIAHGAQPIARAVDIVRQVLSGLAHAHELGIIHRDIKPANLVLSHKTGLGDHVKILDFGLARLHDTGQNLTTGMTVGTPAYMAPEQIRGHALDHRIDLYACGVLLFELLTGAKPFRSERDDPMEICKLHLTAPVPRLAALRPGVAFGELEGIVATALAKVADDRYASAQAFAAALDALDPLVLGRTSRPTPLPVALAAAMGDVSYPPPVELRTADLMVPDASMVAVAPSAPSPAAAPSAPSPAPSAPSTLQIAKPPRGRRAVVLAGAVVLVGVAAAALWAITTRASPAAAHDAGTAIAPPPSDPAGDVLARVDQMVARGERDAAIDVLARSRRQLPDNGPLAYAAGRLYFAKLYWSDGLRSFRDAIRIDPTYRTDPELIKTVLRGFITTPSYNDELASFLRDDIGAAARSFLEETARDHPSAAIRSRAAGELRRY